MWQCTTDRVMIPCPLRFVELCFLQIFLDKAIQICYSNLARFIASGCSAAGSVLDWGSRGRRFKSCHSDQKPPKSYGFGGFFAFPGNNMRSYRKQRISICSEKSAYTYRAENRNNRHIDINQKQFGSTFAAAPVVHYRFVLILVGCILPICI